MIQCHLVKNIMYGNLISNGWIFFWQNITHTKQLFSLPKKV